MEILNKVKSVFNCAQFESDKLVEELVPEPLEEQSTSIKLSCTDNAEPFEIEEVECLGISPILKAVPQKRYTMASLSAMNCLRIEGSMLTSSLELYSQTTNTVFLSTSRQLDKNIVFLRGSQLDLDYFVYYDKLKKRFELRCKQAKIRSRGLFCSVKEEKRFELPLTLKVSHFFIKIEVEDEMFLSFKIVNTEESSSELVKLTKLKEVVVGRKAADLILPSPTISKKQMKITYSGENKVTVINLSLNTKVWTAVEDRSVSLHDKDELRLGDYYAKCVLDKV